MLQAGQAEQSQKVAARDNGNAGFRCKCKRWRLMRGAKSGKRETECLERLEQKRPTKKVSLLKIAPGQT